MLDFNRVKNNINNVCFKIYKMENSQNSYLKTDNNKVINEKCIRWVKKMDECLEVCTKTTGCSQINDDTHKVCKINKYTG
jgi:hypothetical protein